MQNQIISTPYVLPLAYILNGATAGAWTNPQYLLLEDTLTAESSPNSGATCDVVVSNFNLNVPTGAVITGIQFTVRANVGAITNPPATLSFNAYNNLPDTPEYYPYTAPFSDLTQTLATYTFGGENYLFNRAWTADEINNFKLQLIGSGDIFVDDVQVQAFYYIPVTPAPPAPTSGTCLTCESPIQGVEYFLALDLSATDTKAYVYNFNYADGTPIQITDLGDCGGVIEVVLDEGKIAGNGQDFMENAAVVNITTLPSGLVELDFGSITNRGLGFKTPFTSNSNLIGAHSVNAKLIISNSGPYEAKKLRQCQAGVLFSKPIDVQQNSSDIVNPANIFNFTGAVQVTPDSTPGKVNIYIPGTGTTPPVVVGTGSGTSGNVRVSTLTFTIPSSGVNRAVKIEIATEELQTVVSVTANSVALSQLILETDTPNNLRSEQWGLVAPAVGLLTIFITLSGPAYISAGGEVIVGVDQSTSFGSTQTASGTSLNPNLVLTTTYDNSIVSDALTTAQTPIFYTPGSGQTALWVEEAVGDTRQGGASYTLSGTAPDAVTMQYTITQNTPWVYTAVEIKGITSASGSQAGIQFDDESGTPLGTPGTVNEVELTGSVTGVRVGNKVTYTISGGGGNVVQESVHQVAHGLLDSHAVKSSGVDGDYAYAEADIPVDADVVGIITSVVDADNFVITTEGFAVIPTLPGGTVAGNNLWLDPSTPGGLTLTEPTMIGTVSQPVGRVINASTKLCYIHNWRGITNTALPTVTNNSGVAVYAGNHVTSVQNIPHGLAQIPEQIKITAFKNHPNDGSNIQTAQSMGTYNGTTTASIYEATNNTITTALNGTSTSDILLIHDNDGTDSQIATVTFDATNIILSWIKTGSPTSDNINMLWEASA